MLLCPNYTAGGSGIYLAQEITSLVIGLIESKIESIRFVKRRTCSAASGGSESHGEYVWLAYIGHVWKRLICGAALKRVEFRL